MLTAALVCIPSSPKIKAIRSDAPFITFGWSVNSSVEFTNPVNLIHDFILFKSPLHALLACDTILKAHLSAALYPSSVDKSLPNLPLINSPFSEIEIWPEMYNSFPAIFVATYEPTGAFGCGSLILFLIRPVSYTHLTLPTNREV